MAMIIVPVVVMMMVVMMVVVVGGIQGDGFPGLQVGKPGFRVVRAAAGRAHSGHLHFLDLDLVAGQPLQVEPAAMEMVKMMAPHGHRGGAIDRIGGMIAWHRRRGCGASGKISPGTKRAGLDR